MTHSYSPGAQPKWLSARISKVLALAAITLAALLAGMAGTSSAADQTGRLTLQPSADACTAWDQMTCSYLEVRNGNAPAPGAPTGCAPALMSE